MVIRIDPFRKLWYTNLKDPPIFKCFMQDRFLNVAALLQTQVEKEYSTACP